MKVISLLQPRATLWATEEKIYETRSWATKHRGPLGVHASKGFKKELQAMCRKEPFYTALTQAGYFIRQSVVSYGLVYTDLPTGAIIATCELVDCIPITPEFVATLSEKEIAFGDYTPGRFAWKVENVKMLPEPIPAKGQLSLWEYSGL